MTDQELAQAAIDFIKNDPNNFIQNYPDGFVCVDGYIPIDIWHLIQKALKAMADGRVLPPIPKDYLLWDLSQDPAHCLWRCQLIAFPNRDIGDHYAEELDTPAEAVQAAIDKTNAEKPMTASDVNVKMDCLHTAFENARSSIFAPLKKYITERFNNDRKA